MLLTSSDRARFSVASLLQDGPSAFSRQPISTDRNQVARDALRSALRQSAIEGQNRPGDRAADATRIGSDSERNDPLRRAGGRLGADRPVGLAHAPSALADRRDESALHASGAGDLARRQNGRRLSQPG